MNKERFFHILLFSIVVTASMNSLDMLFHLFEGTAVHLNYVAIKLTIIFSSVFLTSLLVGMGKTEGIFASVLGPTTFYIYYKFVFSTLNRQLFRIDDQFWYVFLHIIFFGFSYWLAYYILIKKNYSKNIQNVGRGLALSLMTVALDFIYRMLVVSIESGRNEEVIARTLDPIYALKLFIPLVIIFSLLFMFMKRYRSFAIAILSGIVVFFIDKNILHAMIIVLLTFISYLMIKKVRRS